MKFVGLALLPLLAACAHQDGSQYEPPPVHVSGAAFTADRFACGRKPAAPDPDTVGQRGGSAAANYQNSLASWGEGCDAKLQSVGRELDANGQVVKQD